MDRYLNAHVKLDVASDVIRIDVRGSLTQDSRPDLMQLIQRIRRMGISSHIRVDLAQAQFVESGALAGLRNDLNAIDGGAGQLKVAGSLTVAAGVSLELQMIADDFGRDLQPLDLSADFLASIDPSGTRPLARYSDDELLAASDAVFGKLDNPDTGAPSELLAQYEDISLEMTRREFDREAEPA
jgi:ABC-type transporter Mla MlaB component